jgi:hypothetical protein
MDLSFSAKVVLGQPKEVRGVGFGFMTLGVGLNISGVNHFRKAFVGSGLQVKFED